MTKAVDFLKKQIKEKENVFFGAISFKRAVENRQKKNNYSWETNSYKFYPSSIKSLTMCPKQYVEEEVHKAPNFELPNIYKMEIGKVVHEMYQEWATDLDKEFVTQVIEDISSDFIEALDRYIRIMYKREAENCKILWERPRLLDEATEKKLGSSWPEIPLFDEESGFSLRTDLVLKVDNEPVILDLKTTSVDSGQWLDGYTDKLPDQAHLIQVRIYRYLLNKHKYYDKPIKKVGLGYINLLMKHGTENQEYEVYKDFGEELDTEIEDLITHLSIQRNSWMATKTTKECCYKRCRVHGSS